MRTASIAIGILLAVCSWTVVAVRAAGVAPDREARARRRRTTPILDILSTYPGWKTNYFGHYALAGTSIAAPCVKRMR